MSHKYCECNECKPNTEGAGAKRPIQMMPPPVEGFLFTPEDDEVIAGINKTINEYGDALINMSKFETKDSGQRKEFSTGMQRDVQDDKPRYDLLDKAMLKRWAELMSRGAKKYGEENWRKASTIEELKRFEASLLRHTFQLLEGDRTEDHGAAIMFNVSGYEMVLEKLKK